MINTLSRTAIDGGYILTAAVASQVAVERAVAFAITDTKLWLGVALPHWVGWIVFLIALVFGATISFHQETAVDKYIKHPRLKPYYSFFFGFFAAAFGIPLKYPNLTIFDLVIPALLLSAIGSQVIYYVVAFTSSPQLWEELKSRAMIVIQGGNAK